MLPNTLTASNRSSTMANIIHPSPPRRGAGEGGGRTGGGGGKITGGGVAVCGGAAEVGGTGGSGGGGIGDPDIPFSSIMGEN
jgi:hypothetical protein